MDSKAVSIRRQVENEAIFREHNEAVGEELNELREFAETKGFDSLDKNDDLELHFYCECSDENCRKRIVLSIASYTGIHQNRSAFIVLPHHQVDAIEKVIEKHSKYYVVEKYLTAPEHPTSLHKTDIHNT